MTDLEAMARKRVIESLERARARKRKNPDTERVTGLVISRKSSWAGNGFGTRTRWTATWRGTLLGEWDADSMASCWVLALDGSMQRGSLLYLRDWRHAVVVAAKSREDAAWH